MDYSIIVPHHSNARTLGFCLETLSRTVPAEVEIVVVLNNVDRDEIEIAIDEHRFRALRIPQNLGYGGAINAGVAEARGRTLVFCDDDTAFIPGWFEALARFRADTPAAGSVSAKLLAPGTGRIVDYGIAFTDYNAPHPFMDAEATHPLVSVPRHVQAACSAVMMIDKDVFERAGRFSDRPHAYYNDIDLCLRLREDGLETWVIPGAIAFHRSSFNGVRAAPYKGSALKTDQKAWFMAQHGHRLVSDMSRYFAESFAHHFSSFPGSNEYLLVDLTSIVDRKAHRDLIATYFRIRDVYEGSMYVRDATDLALMEHLGPNLAALNVPLIYFVDRFIALRANVAWARLRDITWDLVIDRNANVRRLADVVERGAV